MSDRLISLSRTGRYAAVRSPTGLEVVDVLGTSARTQIAGPLDDFACVGTMVWVLRGGGRALDRVSLTTGRAIQPSLALAVRTAALTASRCDITPVAVASGDGHVLVHDTEVVPLDHVAPGAFPLGGRRIALTAGNVLRIVEPGRKAAHALHVAGEILSVHALYGGKMMAVLSRGDGEDTWTVLRADGTRVQQLAMPPLARWAVACDAGIAMVVRDGGLTWSWLDLRYGTQRASGDAPFAIDDLDLSSDGRHVLLACAGDGEPHVMHVASAELLASARRTAEVVVGPPPPIDEPPAREPPADEPASEPASDADVAVEPALGLETFVPRALGERAVPLDVGATDGWLAYATPREHLDDMLDLAGVRVARAIAEAHNAGRLGDRRVEHEVRALVGDGDVPALAAGELDRADARLIEATARMAGRVRASLAGGMALPFVELMRELDL